MAKSEEKIIAQNLRQQGKSIKYIAQSLRVSKSSASLWCQDVKLSLEQTEKLHRQMVLGGHKGRMIGAKKQKEARIQKIKNYEKQGFVEIGNVNNRDLLLTGIGLYLGEGNKGRKFQFTNSNPILIKLMIKWLKKCFGVKRERLQLEILINQTHKHRKYVVERYWRSVTRTTNKQFMKTIFIKAKNKKIYDNRDRHYGTLILRARKSTDLQYRILGLCYGISRQFRIYMPV